MDQRQQQQEHQHHRSNLPSERNAISRPQMFMHLEFGLSWSQRHAPQKHTITYTSRSLRDSRSRNNFPRQLPPPNANFLGPDTSAYQHRPRASADRPGYPDQQQQQQPPLQEQQRQQRRRSNYQQESQQQQQRQRYSREQHNHRQSTGYEPLMHLLGRPLEVDAGENAPDHERRRSRSESRGLSHDRGHSAPPPFHDSPWDDAPGLSASLFPPAQPAAAAAAATAVVISDDQETRGGASKPLPATPSHFRLGEDGLPWSAEAWPVVDAGQHSPEEQQQQQSSYAIQSTSVSKAPGSRDDPQRVKELETLSAAMVTVDNGFENQWWYQGPRETTAWWPRDQEERSRLSLADDDLLFSAVTESADAHGSGTADDWYGPSFYNEESPLFDGIVSPVSSASPARPLQRSMTTRSEELFILNDGR